MRTRVSVSLLVSVMIAGCGMSRNAHILSAEDGPALLAQCSRAVPNVQSFWSPSEADVAWAEDALRDFDAVDDAGRYIRQYVGVQVEGTQLLYINAVHPDAAGDYDFGEPVSSCETGTNYWGALYSFYLGEFSELEYNTSN